MSILGNRVLRTEDPAFLTVGGKYLDDLHLPGALHVTYVRSTMAHATFTIDGSSLEDVKAMPGVVDVVTAAEVDLPAIAPTPAMLDARMGRPLLATGVVRFVGEPVAVIVTETRAQGVDAAEMVFVDFEPLPVVVDPEAALDTDLFLFPEAASNVAMTMDFGEDATIFDGCEVVVRQRMVNQRVAPCPLEVRCGAVRWEDDGRMTVWSNTQGPHGVRSAVARHYGLEESQVHVITPDVGGGFGAKIGNDPEDLLLPFLARRAGRPVKWVETRSESMLNLGHGRGQVQYATLGGSRDGILRAYRLEVVQEAGAYPTMGAVLPFMTRTMLTGVYEISKAEFKSRSVVTNTTPTVAYRGAGRPEATAAIERAIDLFAVDCGLDPAEVRRRNLVPDEAFPYTTITGTVYDIGRYGAALDKVLDAAGYDELRAEQQRRRDNADPRQLGIGLSVYVEITNMGGSGEWGAVDVRPDGKVRVRTGTSPHGQGHATSFAMLVADRLGIDLADIEVLHGDTDLVPRGGGTMGSRSLQAGGVAVARAADDVVERAREVAAGLLEASAEDVVLDTAEGVFHVSGAPVVRRTWAEVAAAVGVEGIGAETVFDPPAATFPFGAHCAVVEVDTETGKVTILRMIAVDDAGRILNPLLAEGQLHGGMAQGAAQALLEEFRYDEDGNPQTGNFADYAFITAAELPSFELVSMETPTPVNELGANGIGESGTVGSTPAVQNAVVDALRPFGVRHLDMPATPERVWRAIGGT